MIFQRFTYVSKAGSVHIRNAFVDAIRLTVTWAMWKHFSRVSDCAQTFMQEYTFIFNPAMTLRRRCLPNEIYTYFVIHLMLMLHTFICIQIVKVSFCRLGLVTLVYLLLTTYWFSSETDRWLLLVLVSRDPLPKHLVVWFYFSFQALF